MLACQEQLVLYFQLFGCCPSVRHLCLVCRQPLSSHHQLNTRPWQCNDRWRALVYIHAGTTEKMMSKHSILHHNNNLPKATNWHVTDDRLNPSSRQSQTQVVDRIDRLNPSSRQD